MPRSVQPPSSSASPAPALEPVPVPKNGHAVLHEAIGFMSAQAFKAGIKKLGWSQKRAAAMLGYEPWAVKRWTTGADPVPWLVARTLELYDEEPGMETEPRRVTRFDSA